MKRMKRLFCLLVCLTLLSGLMVTTAEAISYDRIEKYIENYYYKVGPIKDTTTDLSIGLKGGRVYEGMDKSLTLCHNSWGQTTETYYRPSLDEVGHVATSEKMTAPETIDGKKSTARPRMCSSPSRIWTGSWQSRRTRERCPGRRAP